MTVMYVSVTMGRGDHILLIRLHKGIETMKRYHEQHAITYVFMYLCGM